MARTKGVDVQFVPRPNGPEKLVTEAEVVFDEGPLAGTRLTGFCLWRSTEGDLFVTVPARAFGTGAERRYWEFLRGTDGSGEALKRVKTWILDEYRRLAA